MVKFEAISPQFLDLRTPKASQILFKGGKIQNHELLTLLNHETATWWLKCAAHLQIANVARGQNIFGSLSEVERGVLILFSSQKYHDVKIVTGKIPSNSIAG